MENIHLSTVTPVYRGSKTLRKLAHELDTVRRELIANSSPLRLTEAIFVDDGSVDDSEVVLNEIAKEYDYVIVIRLARNYGQHPATMAGILHASGDWVATMDEDLQHHPMFLLSMLKQAVMNQKDVIYANAASSVHNSVYRDVCARIYKYGIAKLSGNPHVKIFSSFRMMRGSIARAAASVSGHQTYFDFALNWFTERIGTLSLPMKDERFEYESSSGYSFRALLSHGMRMLQSSNVKFMRIGALIGSFAMLLAFLVAVYTFILAIFSPELIEVQGWTSIVLAILFFGGLNAFLIGFVLENLSLIVMQSHGKPTFFEVERSRDQPLLKWFSQQDENL